MIAAAPVMTVRPWDREKDYPLIREWFEGNGSLGPHQSHLPPLGIVVEDEDGPLAAVGAYQSVGVSVAFPEWLVTNPDTKPKKKLRAVIIAMRGLERMLVAQGYEFQRIAIIDDRIAALAKSQLGFHNLGPKVHYLMKNTSP